MGIGKSIKKSVSKVTKSVKKAVGKVADAVWDVTKGIVSGEYLTKAIGFTIEFIGNDVVDDMLGLDKIGNEIGDVGSNIYQVGKVLGGEYHDDMKALQAQQSRVQKQIDAYNSQVDLLADKIQSLIAFHEIFQMAASNRLDSYIGQYGPIIDAAIADLNSSIAKLKNEYDFVIGLTEGAFVQRIIGSILMIVGGLMSDLGDIVSGKADGATWKRAVTAIVSIVILVIAIATGQLYLVPAILASIALFMMLDGMYANGAATGAIMGLLDYMFNDVLKLDELIGKDFEKFDKDNEDYSQMVMYTQLALSLASMGTQWGMTPSSVSTVSANGSSSIAKASGNMTQTTSSGGAFGSTGAFKNAVQGSSTTMSYGNAANPASVAANATTTFFGIDRSTYTSIYKAFSAANDVYDVVNAKSAYDALNFKLKEDRLKVEEALSGTYRKNFMKHYKDTAYFLQDQQEFIDRYIWDMISNSMYVDPYGTTPVANIRFTPDKDTRTMSFGFEEIFDDSSSAGSRGYFNSIIYGN